MSLMRAKMYVSNVEKYGDDSERVDFAAVCKKEGYTDDGSDENNTYAKFAPSADLTMCIQNPNLWGQFNVGDEFYLDFTKAGE